MTLFKLAMLPALLSASWAAHANLVFTDPTLALADYTQVLHSPDPSVTITISTLAAGGNPGSALDIRFSNQNTPVSMNSFQGFINNTFSYDPSAQGALSSLSYANDRYVSVGPELAGLVSVTRSLLRQGGQYYVAIIADPAAQPRDAWFTTAASGLTGGMFNGFDFTTGLTDASLHPDFSATGSVLAFGFANRLFFDTGGQAVNLRADFRYDNISYDLAVNAVPEPQTWTLLLVALLALGAVTQRTRRRRPVSAAS